MKQNKKVKRYYAVMGIYQKGIVPSGLAKVDGTPFMQNAIFTDTESGIVGIIPVFTNKRKAERFAGKHEIMTLEVVI